MKPKNNGIVFLLITVLFFSTFEVTSKLIGSRLHPFQICFLRFFLGGLILLPFAVYKVKQEKIHISFHHLKKLILLGIVNIIFSMGLLQFSLVYADAAIVAVIFSSNPLAVSLFAALILKENINKAKIIGMLMGVAGVIVLFIDKISLDSFNIIGPLLAAASAVFYGLCTVIVKKLLSEGSMGSLVITAFSFIAGSVLLLPIMWVFKVPVMITDISLLPHILYLSVFVTGIAYMCYFYGLSNVEASTGSLVFFIKPVLASIIAVIVLGETLHLSFYIGTLIVLSGVFVINSKTYNLHGKLSSLCGRVKKS